MSWAFVWAGFCILVTFLSFIGLKIYNYKNHHEDDVEHEDEDESSICDSCINLQLKTPTPWRNEYKYNCGKRLYEYDTAPIYCDQYKERQRDPEWQDIDKIINYKFIIKEYTNEEVH